MRKFFKSVSFAFAGIKFVWKQERNFKIQIIAGFLVIILALISDFSVLETALLIVAIALVLAAELANTAAEDILDMLEKKYNSQVGKIKDISAAAVLVISLGALLVGLLVFYSHFAM